MQVLVRVVPVGPRRATLAEQTFALFLSAAWNGDLPADPTDSISRCSHGTGSVQARQGPFNGQMIGHFSDASGRRCVSRLRRSPAGEVRSPALAVPPIDLKTWVRTPVSSSYAVRVPKGPDEKGKEPLVRQLDALATSWGAIADSLKLVRYFRVELPPGSPTRKSSC